MALILKKVVGSGRSMVIPAFRSASLQTHRRSFFSGSTKTLSFIPLGSLATFFIDVLHRFLTRPLFYEALPNNATIIGGEVFKYTPHTLRTTVRVIGEDDNEEGLSLGEPIKCSVNIPGIEKTTETGQQFNIFIDLGLKLEADEFDGISSEARLSKPWNNLYLQGYMEKQDVRRNYTALISLPMSRRLDDKAIATEIKDGGLWVTVPKLANW